MMEEMNLDLYLAYGSLIIKLGSGGGIMKNSSNKRTIQMIQIAH